MEKLCDICDFQGGSQPPKEEWSFEKLDGYVRMLQIRDFTQSERAVPEYIKISSSTKLCEEDDILIARYGASLGKILTGLAGAYNVAIMKIIPDTSKVLKRYLYYYLKSNYFQMSILNVGSRAAQAGFNKEDLAKLDINCPSIDEQRKIVDVLDNIEQILLYEKQQLADLDILIKARFVEMFGDIHAPSKWEKKPWSELVTIQNGRDYKNILVESGGYPVYGTGGEMARASEYLCPENTIIVGRKGTINNPLLVKEKFWNVDTAFGVIVGNQLHYQYFYNFCRMFDFSTLNKQAVLPSTTKADLLKIEMAVPPMELQNQFATFVEQTDKSKFVA